MLEVLIGILIGAVAASVIWFFVARNNRRYIDEVLDYDLSADNLSQEAIEAWGDFKAKFKK